MFFKNIKFEIVIKCNLTRLGWDSHATQPKIKKGPPFLVFSTQWTSLAKTNTRRKKLPYFQEYKIWDCDKTLLLTWKGLAGIHMLLTAQNSKEVTFSFIQYSVSHNLTDFSRTISHKRSCIVSSPFLSSLTRHLCLRFLRSSWVFASLYSDFQIFIPLSLGSWKRKHVKSNNISCSSKPNASKLIYVGLQQA